MGTVNMNSILPTFQGNYKDMVGALRAGKINSPCWFWIEDRNDLAFIHWEKDETGEKILVPHVILWEQMETIKTKVQTLTTQTEGLIDSETQEPIKIVDYVSETITPIENTVADVSKDVNEMKKNGNAILITSEE